MKAGWPLANLGSALSALDSDLYPNQLGSWSAEWGGKESKVPGRNKRGQLQADLGPGWQLLMLMIKLPAANLIYLHCTAGHNAAQRFSGGEKGWD